MNDAYIISKMNEYMFQLTEKMGGWLEKKLPRITPSYWEDLVLSNLSPLQRDHVLEANLSKISQLDLAALLKVVDRNWFVITNTYFINNRERSNIKKMIEVRNTWAHITPADISKEKVLDDMDVIISLMQAFDAKMSETKDMETFRFDVDEDKEIQINIKEIVPVASSVLNTANKVEQVSSDSIAVGSVVTLVSDKSVVGAVIGVNGDKYSVLVGTDVQTFYREQIELQKKKEEHNQISIKRVRSALTAYQINNPSSSSLYSLNSARIDFVPYQFRPALKMIKADSPRLLVADDVGVGKTIEAGLILKELEARSNINSVLIICPRPLVAEKKWELEMKRFDENFVQLDGKMFSMAMQEADRDGEWSERLSKAIIPYSLFSEDSVDGTQSTSNKKKKTIGLSELDPLPHFDLVIVDEAHNIRNSNTYAYRGVELFCRNADAVVFLTATPLQNSNNDLYTLLNLLRPDLIIDKDTFNTMAEPNAYVNELLRVVRNQEDGWQDSARSEISNILGTQWGRNVVQHNPNFAKIFELLDKDSISRDEKVQAMSMIESLHSFNTLINRTRRKDIEDFCIRRTITVKSPFSGVQRDLYETLIDFESKALASMYGQQSVRFMMCTIMRQASSCIYGLAPFLDQFVSRRLAQIREDGELYENDIEIEEEALESLSDLAMQVADLAERLPDADPKFEKLLDIVLEKQNEENNRVILFSSFRNTLAYVKRKLEQQGLRVGLVHGGVADEERYRIRERFRMDRNEPEAIDILLFSEVGCEGLDYQFCDTMVNYDLPWNPMRIEQRIGRIDRRGQQNDTVKIYNMITEDTIDEAIYDRCLSKIGVFEASIGDCSEILGDISEQIMKIMFDNELTDEERRIKLEQMADNEVRAVQEMQQLEQDEKALFGFDLTNYIQNKDVQEAECDWITPDSINALVNLYMNDYLGDGEYIRGKSELKTLTLASDKRQILLDDLKKSGYNNNNNAMKLWRAYLKSDKPRLSVTFDSLCAKDNRSAAFFTQMHPFIVQAAKYESKQFPCEVGVSVSDENLPAGDYEFLIYAWKYVGIKPDIKLVAVSNNEAVQKYVLSSLQFATDYAIEGNHDMTWDDMDSIHREKWQNAKKEYAEDVREECEYRMEQMTHSYTQREMIYRNMIQDATDEKIIRMRTSQLEKLKKDYDSQKKQTEDTIHKADIHTNLLVRGVLHVESC